MNRILSFWTSLQDRERAIMKILAIAILIGLASFFYTNILGSINKNKNILVAKKNEFDYVYQQKNLHLFLSDLFYLNPRTILFYLKINIYIFDIL